METLHIFTSSKVITLVEKKPDITGDEVPQYLSIKNTDEKVSFFINIKYLSLSTRHINI